MQHTRITYLLSCRNNPLYYGAYLEHNKYKTYGLHSFIYDFINTALRNNVQVEIGLDDVNTFPLTDILQRRGVRIFDLNKVRKVESDIILVDSLTQEQYRTISLSGFVAGIIHNYLLRQPELFYAVTDKVICMTEMALQKQREYATQDNLVVIRQGIDLERFRKSKEADSNTIRSFLVYSRMDRYKGKIYIPIIEYLIANGYDVTVLGDGQHFQYLVQEYGDRITPISYIPCFAIHHFIDKFDVVISNGRGVMEGIAMGKPTIAAAMTYCGLIDEQNAGLYFESNFTGSNVADKGIRIADDIERIKSRSFAGYHEIARNLFDANLFLTELINLVNSHTCLPVQATA